MFWWVTVPAATDGSHIEIAELRSRPGSRYRYCLVSSARTPGLVASRGMYAKAARRAFSNAR